MINGITPELKKTTELGIKSSSFDEAMENFCNTLTENCQDYISGFRHIDSVRFGTNGGRKFIKVSYWETNVHTDYETNETTLVTDKKGRIHCFVEIGTGDIYKPASWKTPYTKGNNAVRGNIFDTTTFEKTDLHGGWLYQK